MLLDGNLTPSTAAEANGVTVPADFVWCSSGKLLCTAEQGLPDSQITAKQADVDLMPKSIRVKPLNPLIEAFLGLLPLTDCVTDGTSTTFVRLLTYMELISPRRTSTLQIQPANLPQYYSHLARRQILLLSDLPR